MVKEIYLKNNFQSSKVNFSDFMGMIEFYIRNVWCTDRILRLFCIKTS